MSFVGSGDREGTGSGSESRSGACPTQEVQGKLRHVVHRAGSALASGERPGALVSGTATWCPGRR